MLHYRKAESRLQMPQVAGEGLSDENVKRAIIQTAVEHLSACRTRPHRRLRVQQWDSQTCGYNFELAALSKKATRGGWQNDLGHFRLCRHQRWLRSIQQPRLMPFMHTIERRNETWFLICKLMASTSMKSMPLSCVDQQKRSSIQSHSILPGIDSSQSNQTSRVDLCCAWQDPSKLSRWRSV